MKRKFWMPAIAVLSGLVLVSCFKNEDVKQCTPNTLEKDRLAIDSFISAEYLNYLSYDADLKAYKGISNPGAGSSPAADSIVAFKRTVSFFNGNKMVNIGTDSISQSNSGTNLRFSDIQTGSDVYYFLSNTQLGGSARMIYPSSWNYFFLGCQQQSLNNGQVIPAYSQVVIDYKLTGVKKGF